MGIEYKYNCNSCDEDFDSDQELSSCPQCNEGLSVSGPFFLKYEEHGVYECSECGDYVTRPDDVCSRSCFNAMMR